jgi:hypothetical protein
MATKGGANTEHSGSRMRPEALQAIEEAAQVFLAIPELLDAAGQLIAKAIDPPGTTVEAAAVCAGAPPGDAKLLTQARGPGGPAARPLGLAIP